MDVRIEHSWKEVLQAEFDKPYFEQLTDFVRQEYRTCIIYPPASLIFNAFDSCSFSETKVVILGQDPYHGAGQACGLCFSVNDGIPLPPSLINIYREITDDLGIRPFPSGNLARWSRQGVLLLNATLTVRANSAGSHQKQGWETFTDAVIRAVSAHCNHVVFMLWGGYAKEKAKLIDPAKHCILTAGHPSPLSANRGYWFGNKHFSQANAYLKANGKNEIVW